MTFATVIIVLLLMSMHLLSLTMHEQCIDEVKESLSQSNFSPLSGYYHLFPKESDYKVLCEEALKEMEHFYTPLGNLDVSDLPSFAYQSCQGIVRI